MMEKRQLLSGAVAIGAYVVLLFAMLYYFGYRSEEPTRNYVDKNEKAIAVSLAGPTKTAPKQTKKTPPKKPKKKPKKVRKTPDKPKKAPPPKPTKKATKVPKKVATKSLFSSVKTPKKSTETTPRKKSSTQKSSIKKTKESQQGIVNIYFAKIQKLLRGWPAQANFAGETIDVVLTVYASGSFDYKIITYSANAEFNQSLEAYLRQLQKIGFGSHSHGKPYELEVKFVAKE